MSEKNYCVYIIYSPKLNRNYVGTSDAFERRLQEHNAGLYGDAFTAKGIPWQEKLVISELTSRQAYAMETHIKSMKSTKYIENLLKYPELVDKLRKRFE